jgi:hypothetical protein
MNNALGRAMNRKRDVENLGEEILHFDKCIEHMRLLILLRRNDHLGRSRPAPERLHGVIELAYLQVLIRCPEGLVKINDSEIVVATRVFQDSRKVQTLPLTADADFGPRHGTVRY